MLDENRSAGTRPGDATEQDENPILEIFGAAPLVHEPSEPRRVDDERNQLLDTRLESLERALENLQRQASFLPPKLRGLGERVDALATVLSDGRCRSLLTELCTLDDLVHAGLAAREAGDLQGASRVLAAVGASLSALLENQGLRAIETDGVFDPTRHQAVRQMPVDDAAFHGVILEVDRRGFCVDERVLRFAEVAVGHHEPTPDHDLDPDPDPDLATDHDDGADEDHSS